MARAWGYQDALDYLKPFINSESGGSGSYHPERFTPETFDIFLQTLGAPHQAFPSIHIAGSKGKGSTAAIIASILTRAGLRTGLFTSPHLVTIRERIQIDRQLISPETFAALVEELQPHIDARDSHLLYPVRTFFEILTALSFLYFARQHIDIAVIETGLGGRLDTTNVLTPNVVVLTPIGLEHTHILGHTLAEIATEKAGIIKPNSWVVSAEQAPEVIEVFERRCQAQRATLCLAGRDFAWHVSEVSTRGTILNVERADQTFSNLQLPLLGRHQGANAAVALVAALELRNQGFAIDTSHLVEGLRETDWAGRLEVIQQAPSVVLDAGHTPEAAQTLRQALQEVFDYQRLWLILGVSQDKNHGAIVDCLAPFAHRILVTSYSHPRACPPDQLAAEVRRHSVPLQITENAMEALKQAQSQADTADLICLTGSLFLLGELKAYQQGLPIEF